MGINQFDPDPDPHFQFLCEHGASILFVKSSPTTCSIAKDLNFVN